MTDVTVTVGAVAHGGHCVARHEGRVIFVRHALPGERVVARLTEAADDARFWRADAIEILEASADRVDTAWPDAGAGGVGGGELGHVALPAQRDWKFAVLADAFERFAKTDFPGSVYAAPGDDEQGGLGYRTRVSAVADAEGRAAMRVFRSHDVRALTRMPIATAAAEEALLGQRFPAGSTISVVDPSDGEIFVAVNGDRWNNSRPDTRANAAKRVREVVTIDGEQRRMVVDATGFWQVHREAPSLLASRVRALAGSGKVALDLYSGAGLLTAALEPSFERVVSIETDTNSVRAARRNLSQAEHVAVTEGDVRATLRATLADGSVGPVDVIVLDPPRSGAGADTIAAVAAHQASRVVYVACDPVALARDTALLAKQGYSLVSAEAWDLFPMTHHVEAIAVFERK